MSRDMTLTFSDGNITIDIANFGAILQDSRFMPAQPITKFVEVPGRAKPLNISRVANGYMTYDSAYHEYDVAFISNSTIAANNANAKNFCNGINGKLLEVSDFSGTYDAEVSVTKFDRVGEYVLMTIRALVV